MKLDLCRLLYEKMVNRFMEFCCSRGNLIQIIIFLRFSILHLLNMKFKPLTKVLSFFMTVDGGHVDTMGRGFAAVADILIQNVFIHFA